MAAFKSLSRFVKVYLSQARCQVLHFSPQGAQCTQYRSGVKCSSSGSLCLCNVKALRLHSNQPQACFHCVNIDPGLFLDTEAPRMILSSAGYPFCSTILTLTLCIQVADNLPLYGVCCYMEEMLHRPPSLLKAKYPDCNIPLTRYMVAAPRCYCFLTHYPFFSLHMKVCSRCRLQHYI